MQVSQYVALLRGINVGGNNLIKMADLKAYLQSNGFPDATTYIQSGNILFSNGGSAAQLSARLQALIAKRFGCEVVVVVKSLSEMKHIITHAPNGFGSQPVEYKYDILFFKDGTSMENVLQYVSVRKGVDTAAVGDGVLYFSRLIAQLTKTHLNKIISTPVYKDLTIRNWNTSTKLLALMEASEAAKDQPTEQGIIKA